LKLDIACIAEFENPNNIQALNRLGTDVYYVGTSGPLWKRPYAYYSNTLKLLRSGGYDCVHIHGDVAYLLLIFAKAARRAGVKKIILHSHAAGLDGGSRRLKAVLHRLCQGALIRSATDFAACSDKAAAWMFPGLDASRVAMVVNGIDNNAYDGGKYEFSINSLSGLVGDTEKTVPATFNGKRVNFASTLDDFNGVQGYFKAAPKFLLDCGADTLLVFSPAGAYFKHPVLKNLEAVKKRRVIYFENSDMFQRPGPRFFEGVEKLRKALEK
jgi:hypothetical protein